MGKKIFYWFLITMGFLLVLMSIYTVVRLKALGAFTEVEKDFAGTCSVVAEATGPEALQLNREDSVLYFISNNPCAVDSSYRGGIYYLKLTGSDQTAKPFTFDHPRDFHPHGLSFFSLYRPEPFELTEDSRNKPTATAWDQQKAKYLFTNNHRNDGTHTVEIFRIAAEGKLAHEITISGNQLTSPNDLVAVGPRQFYVTNDGRSHNRSTRSIDSFLGRKTGNVSYYDGYAFTKIVDNLNFPNGIVFNKPLNQLIVAETLSGRLLFYRMDENNKISSVDNLYIGSGIDNISLYDHEQIIAAVHPNLFALSRHMKDVNNKSPSQVVIVSYQTKGLKIIYQDTGSAISGLSAAIKWGGDLYLGAVCDNKLLKCSVL